MAQKGRRTAKPFFLQAGEKLGLQFFYSFLSKSYSFRICFLIDSVSVNDRPFQEEVFETSSLDLGLVFEEFFIEKSFVPWFEEVVQFHRIRINETDYHLSPTLQGAALETHRTQKGTYMCRLFSPNRTYSIKIRGFCGIRSSFESDVLSGV
uniref:Uncharacterized protein n=1 Tax=Rhipiliopsis peltata TaxID=2320810 RepID=A0A386B1C0_9CHLO|nr:hypothetical protein [Rhipiliopsis peltata]AYC65492.1 hypothetical protein [Rhipiliopsis peltata]